MYPLLPDAVSDFPAFDTVRADFPVDMDGAGFLAALIRRMADIPGRGFQHCRTMKSLDESFPGMWGILGGLDAADPGLKLSGMRGTSPPAEPASSKSLGGHLWAGIPPARGARFRPVEQRRHDPGHPPAYGAPRPAVHALPSDGVAAAHLRNTAPGDLPRYAGHPMLQKPLAAGCVFRVSRASAGYVCYCS